VVVVIGLEANHSATNTINLVSVILLPIVASDSLINILMH